MKRKVIAITLTAMMAAGMLAGCGSSDSSSSSTADTTKRLLQQRQMAAQTVTAPQQAEIFRTDQRDLP